MKFSSCSSSFFGPFCCRIYINQVNYGSKMKTRVVVSETVTSDSALLITSGHLSNHKFSKLKISADFLCNRSDFLWNSADLWRVQIHHFRFLGFWYCSSHKIDMFNFSKAFFPFSRMNLQDYFKKMDFFLSFSWILRKNYNFWIRGMPF